MTIDLRQDAPDQSDVIDPQKLSEEIEKLKSIQNKISTLKAQIKDLEEDEKYFVFDVIPKLMYDMKNQQVFFIVHIPIYPLTLKTITT